MSEPNPPPDLQSLEPRHEFFVGIDSDGCVFDTMDLKHRECFVPMFIRHFGLQAVAREARSVWEFVNLYSRTRGINRYPALSNALNLLAEHPTVVERGVPIPSSEDLDAWMAREPRHTLSQLRTEVQQRRNTALAPVLAWSEAVDEQIEGMVHGVPPFPAAREALVRLSQVADILVVSQTPQAALEREWAEHGLASCTTGIAGQESGSKRDQLKQAAAGKYPSARILMIGDAPGDYLAARSNLVSFLPILPGREEASWRRFLDEGLDAFLTGQFTGDYEAGLLREFQSLLPDQPSW